MSDELEKLRNIVICAHVDHGKTTLTDSFAARAGLISADDAGSKRWADTREDEKERGITIKSTGISMDINFENVDYHVNLIDTPGHIDFNMSVSAALRIVDGAIVVVDAVEGVAVQTETVLRQALAEQIKPILYINKLDRYFFELHLTPDEAYERLVDIISKMNNLVSMYKSENSSLNLELSPALGTVYFGSGLHGWGFGIHNFANRLSKKTGVDKNTYMNKLWGDYFFDPDTKKYTTESIKNGKPLERTFCKFILGPIFQIVQSIMKKDTAKYMKMLESIDVNLSAKELEKPEKEIYKLAMKRFLPVADALMYGVVHYLPSPKQAQQYRCSTLYDGPQDDEFATSIKKCDPTGPLMLYISNMIPTEDGGRFYAFGRIFSGTIKTGQKVTILGTNYKHGSTDELFENKSIQRVIRMVGGRAEPCDTMQCGNTVALVGIDQYVLKSCTVTSDSKAYPIKTMKFSVSPVVRVSVLPKNVSELPKLIEGMKKLSKSDPCVQTYVTDEGENIIAGVGELHIEICLNDLRAFMKSDIKVSDPVVPLRETVVEKSSQVCLSKSPNKHNRLYVTAEPLHPELVDKMANKDVSDRDDVNIRSKLLVNDYGWDVNDSKKIWAFGPTGPDETNVFVDITKGLQYLNEIKDSVVGGFQTVCNRGVLCGEPLQGVRFNLHDCTLHADNIHRGGGQIIPTAQRVLMAAMLTAQPAILEPVYLIEIQVPDQYLGTVYSCLSYKRGKVISEEKTVGALNIVKGYLPVMESFGFNGFIREQTSGQAFPQMVFDHWEIMNGDPLDPTTKVGQIVRATRKRKGLPDEIPALSDLIDKL